jgi:tRNA 2-selenouridine synthase
MIIPILPEQVFKLLQEHILIDVRSPKEYLKGHIPSAYNVPLLLDDQRALVGTIYKQQGKQQAISRALEFVEPQLERYAQKVKEISIANSTASLIVYCWRGGMRSKSFGMFLARCGYSVYQMIGGQKAYKAYVRKQAELPYKFIVLGGKTGCGKTRILQELKKQGEQVLDLELLAGHRGSSFGGLGKPQQPTQEQFIINCFSMLAQCNPQRSIWVEKESYKIGDLSTPYELWRQLQKAPVLYIDRPQEERITLLLEEYGAYEPENLKTCTLSLSKKIGSAQAKKLCQLIDEKKYEEVIRQLIIYYDKLYDYSLQKSKNLNVMHMQLSGETIENYAYTIKNYVYQR